MEINESRPWQLKGDLGGSFSDADSGYDDPGVITIPVIRTVFHNDSKGRKISTISTKCISVQKRNEKNDLTSCRHLHSPNESQKTPSHSTTSLDSHQSFSNKISENENSRENFDQLNFPSEFFGETKVSPESDFTMNFFNVEDFEISRFQKENRKEDESERKLRFLSAPRDKKGRRIPTIRDICESNSVTMNEETTIRVPRKRFRSKSADGRKVRGPHSLFSPIYSKVLSPETMRKRKIWADAVKRDCILEEEYYKVPYEECNREIVLSRYSSPEALLYNFRRLKKQCSDKISDNDGNLKEKKNHKKIEYRNDSPKKMQEMNYIDAKYVKSLIYDTYKNVQPFNTLSWEKDFNFPLVYQDKTQSATDQIQQLINDLNHIAFADLKTDFEKGNYTNIYRNDSKLASMDPEYKTIKFFNGNVSDSIVTRKPNLIGDDQDHSKIVEPHSHRQEKKMKTKKKVSFSNENEEVVFDSNFSDSESSVFEDKNETKFIQLNTNDKETCFPQCKNETLSHNPFVINTIKPHNLGSLTSSDQINKNNVKSINSHKNEAESAKSSSARYGQPFCSPEHSHLLTTTNSRTPVNEKENKSINRQFYSKDHETMKKDFSLKKTPNLNNSFSQDTPFYSNLPYETQKENVKTNKKKTSHNNDDFRKDKINIYMTKGPSFAEHEIHLLTRTLSPNPNISISRVRVPLSSIRDQWQWTFYLQQQARKNKKECSQVTPPPCSHSPSPPPHVAISSPTPSCESAASFSGNSLTTSGCSVELYSPPLSPFTRSKGVFPTSL